MCEERKTRWIVKNKALGNKPNQIWFFTKLLNSVSIHNKYVLKFTMILEGMYDNIIEQPIPQASTAD